MINVGVIGLGFMGVTHIKAYRKIQGVRLAAICDAVRLPLDGDFSKVSGNVGDTDPLRLDMTQLKASKNFEDLLSDPAIDLIDICVPTPGHAALSVAGLKAGKHVICEKPLARTSAQAEEIVIAAAHSKGFFMPAMCLRFWPEWAWAKKAIHDQSYGKVLAARLRRVCEPPGWGRDSYFKGEQSGGALLDLHIHDTDFIQFCFGRPRSVFSSGLSRFSGAIDYVITQYQVEGGAAVSAEGSWLMTPKFGFNMSYTINFERATADYDIGRGPEALRLYEEGQPPRTIQCSGPDGYVGELQHMIDSIRSGQPPSIVTARDALSAVEICEAEEASARSGKVVEL